MDNESSLPAPQQAVALVAETLARHATKRVFRRKPSPMIFVPIAREIVAELFIIQSGRFISRATINHYADREFSKISDEPAKYPPLCGPI